MSFLPLNISRCMHAPLSHILEDLVTTYRAEKESAIIYFDGSIAF